jgi:hypothetical protein
MTSRRDGLLIRVIIRTSVLNCQSTFVNARRAHQHSAGKPLYLRSAVENRPKRSSSFSLVLPSGFVTKQRALPWMPSAFTNRASARRIATALSTMRRSPTRLPRDSTQYVVSKSSQTHTCSKPGTAINVGGADGKVAQLDDLYPHLRKEGLISTPTITILAPAQLLDLATVIKVSRPASGEMVSRGRYSRRYHCREPVFS